MSLKNSLAHLFHPRRSNNHRPRLLHPEALAFLTIIALTLGVTMHSLSSFSQDLSNVLGYASNISAPQVVSSTNAERQSLGLAPLTVNSALSSAAFAKGQDMFAKQYWAHTSPTGQEPWSFISAAGYRYTVAGENLARDFDTTSPMMAAWMNSPTHRANIVNPRYTEIGIAVINGSLQGVETTLVVQMFGTPAGGIQPAAEISNTGESVQLAETSPSPTVQESNAEVKTETEVSPTPLPSPSPSVVPTQMAAAPEATGNIDLAQIAEPVSNGQVLARFFLPTGGVTPTIVFSPLQLLKALFLAITMIILTILMHDMAAIGNRHTLRFVGKNLGHILLFGLVVFLLLSFKGGVVL